MRKLLCIILICILTAGLFSGCGLLQKLGLQENNDEELRPVSSIAMNEEDAKKLTDKSPVHLYFANEENTKLRLEVRYIPASEAKKSVNSLATTIIKELINGPDKNSGLKPTIPEGTKLNSRIKIDSATSIATVDFSKEFVTKHPGGKIDEQLTIYSIVNTLTELKEIKKVRFTVGGKTLKEYKGNYQFDVPFPRVASLISKDAKVPAPTLAPTAAPEKKDTDKINDTENKSKDSKGSKTEEGGSSKDTINQNNLEDMDDLDQFME